MTHALLFDIDATLLLSGGAGARALDRAFEEVTGVPDGMAGVPFHGMTDFAIIRQMATNKIGHDLSDADRDEVRRLYAVYIEPELETSPGFRVMDGVVPLLDRLAANSNYLLGLATGNFEETAQLKLARGGLQGYFDFGGFGSDSESRPELTKIAVNKARERAGKSPDQDGVFVIGDTIYDIRCGKEAGATTIGVATGITTEDELRAEGADAVLHDLSDAEAFMTLIER